MQSARALQLQKRLLKRCAQEHVAAEPDADDGPCSAVPFQDASVPPETAAAIARLARSAVHWPPFGRLHEFLELRMRGPLGMHAASRSSFDCGDLVLSEDVLLRLPRVACAVKGQLKRRFGAKAPFLMPALAVDWDQVSEDVRQAVLKLFWAHPCLDTADRSSLLEENLQACEDLWQWHEPLRERWSVQDLMRFLNIADLNIHSDTAEPGQSDLSGLFLLGSKFSHSCSPNCRWSFSEEGYLQYWAVRPISPGDLFTFSYVGNGMNLIMSTLDRRRQLASLWFICQCGRCMGPDLARRMQCPSCGAPQLLPQYEIQDGTSIDWTAEHEIPEVIPDAQTWQCGWCGCSAAADQLPLETEAELGELVPRVMQEGADSAAGDAEALVQLRQRAARAVGAAHWTWALATFAWLQKCLHLLRGSPAVGFGERDLRLASAAVAGWLAEAAPENSEQRLTALVLAAQLAEDLGGGLRSWGHELRGAPELADRLAAHGWRASEGAVWGPGRRGGAAAEGPPRGGAAAPGRPFRALWR